MRLGIYTAQEVALTRVELLAVIFALVLFCTVTLAVSTAESSRSAACHNNLRQLGRALLCYADDNDGRFPPRGVRPFWPERLVVYYKDPRILTCPSDGARPASLPSNPTNAADGAPRSYIFNGWGDYFAARGLPNTTEPFPESAILEPSQTILFGEKATDSFHWWFDYLQVDDQSELENGRHFRSRSAAPDGASNHVFADGSVRLLPWGAAFNPVNLWLVEPQWRTNGF
jgi:hypothetical protein